MEHRVGQRQIPVVFGVEEVEFRRRMPLAQPDARLTPPAEYARRLGLVGAVDHHGAVRRGAAEKITPLRFAGVGVGPCIYEAWFAEDRALHAQEIGMPMTTADRAANRPDVDDGLVPVCLPAAPHHRVTA